MTVQTRQHRHQAGFSLTELMVAITIGLIILAAVAAMFVSTNKAYNNEDRLARVQENGRFAMYYLMRDLRMASFMGCRQDITNILSNDLSSTTGFFYSAASLAIPVEGIDDVTSISNPTWAPSGSKSLPSNPAPWATGAASIAKPDMLTIREVNTAAMSSVNAAMSTGADNITVQSVAPFAKQDIIMIADCQHADLAQITDIIPAPTNQLVHSTTSCTGITPCNTQDLQYLYGVPIGGQPNTAATVYKFATRRYYIGLNGSGIPSLYVDENGGTPVELVQGIESMKFLYGVAVPPNTQPSYYRKAGALNATDWPNVVSIKIGILARTSNAKDTDADNNTYNVNGTFLGPFNDRNSRRVFTATVSLKEKILPP